MLTRAVLLSRFNQNLYETVRSLELAHQRQFEVDELLTIARNYYKKF